MASTTSVLNPIALLLPLQHPESVNAISPVICESFENREKLLGHDFGPEQVDEPYILKVSQNKKTIIP